MLVCYPCMWCLRSQIGAIYLFYMQQNVNRPVKSFCKITSGRGGFTTRLLVRSRVRLLSEW